MQLRKTFDLGGRRLFVIRFTKCNDNSFVFNVHGSVHRNNIPIYRMFNLKVDRTLI